MKKSRFSLCLFLAVTMLVLTGTTGCGKKEVDPNGSEIMKLQFTPEPTPTPVPEDASPEAVTSKGSVTMVNEYLDKKIKEEKKASAEAAAQAQETSDIQEESKED